MTDPSSLATLTTLQVGGPARRMVTAETETDLMAEVAAADAAGEPVLLVGGGSNLLISDAGFPGVAIRVATSGIAVDSTGGPRVRLTVAAGEVWDGFVAYCVDHGFAGVEVLSGIPGTVGATPIQNVGAYGREVADSIAQVHTWDRRARRSKTFTAAECGFGYRSSIFKRDPGRYLVLSVSFGLDPDPRSRPVLYAELADRLGMRSGEAAPLAEVREKVLQLRRSKGMVLDVSDPDTHSAGSFFTNPVLTAAQADALPPAAPRFPASGSAVSTRAPSAEADHMVKTSAAWLIEHAGFPKGYGTPPATLSTKHTLALTNRGGATAADLIALAREVRDGVERSFGIRLEPEPVLVGIGLD